MTVTASGRFVVDSSKFDRGMAIAAGYARWLRFRVHGLEHVPAEGGALLVGNHTGLRLHDCLGLGVAIRRQHPACRIVRGLAHPGIGEFPLAAKLQLEYLGAVIGKPKNARALLDDGWLVATYPEGAKSTARPFRQRDSVLPLTEWGTGFARLAIEAQVPIIPVGVSGVEAAIPTIWNSARLGRRFGLQDDLYPVSPQSFFMGFQPFLTPLLPFPVRCGLAFGPPILPRLSDDARADPAAVREAVRELAAVTRRHIQNTISQAKKREGVRLG